MATFRSGLKGQVGFEFDQKLKDNWDDIVDISGWWGDHSDVLVKAAGPGKWNDPDMLIGGNYALTVNQAKVQFGLWAIMAAPMFLSTDLRYTFTYL